MDTTPPQEPVVLFKDAESLAKASQTLCDAARNLPNKLVSSITTEIATFENVLLPLLENENAHQAILNPISIYSVAGPNIELRRLAAEAEKKISLAVLEGKMNTQLFQLIDTVYQKRENDKRLDSESRKALIEERRTYYRRGLTSPSVTRIVRRLKDIEAEFMKNLDEKPHYLWLTLDDLVGVPDSVLSELERGTGDRESQFKLHVSGMQARWLLGVVRSPETRRLIYLASRRIAKENIPLFTEAIQLRRQSAYLLGYSNHLAYRVEITMAKTSDAVVNLLTDVRDRVLRQLPGDIQKLLDMKREDPAADGQPDDDKIVWSDLMFYSSMYEEKYYSLDQNMVAEYFPLHPTVQRMLSLFGRLFGFAFVKMTDNDNGPTNLEKGLVWHPDVTLYTVWNDKAEGGDFIGFLYLDLYLRPGKSSGAQCRPLQLGFERSNGQWHYPSTVLLTNFHKPEIGSPSLLRHADVVLLFHELGHGMHDLSGRCRYSRFHGAETASDFNEAPSQMLEEWCWDARSLKLLSGHYLTEDPLPEKMIASLLRTRVVLPAVKLLPQLRMTLFDADVHSVSRSDSEPVDVAKIYSKHNDYAGIGGVGDEYGYASYRQLFSGNDGLMYSYLWSKVLAADMFDTMFEQDPLNSEVGRHYRHMVLEKGGSQDEMDTFVQFLGRMPRYEAFYRLLGLE
ncbi:hypothetical protein F4777DRAFT_566511 [Nemania sp. FL0916]|nr:hypothetical protein F4777DRAFT_566511 [Nemania sp. FL0916]